MTLGAIGGGDGRRGCGEHSGAGAVVRPSRAPVWVDEATRRLAVGGDRFRRRGEHRLEGQAAPLRLWRATRVLSGVGGAQRVDGLEAPLAGRDAELRTVKELFHACAERRYPAAGGGAGAAGVGKSRLGWEFEKYIDGLVEECCWHRGRCLSYGEGVAFWALAEIVRQRFGIAEDEAPIGRRQAREPAARFMRDEAERTYVGLRLGRLLGITFPGDTGAVLGREELFAGWRLFFERLARPSPVVLLIEDAQHADPARLDFVEHVIDWARDAPIYVLIFARPDLTEQRPG